MTTGQSFPFQKAKGAKPAGKQQQTGNGLLNRLNQTVQPKKGATPPPARKRGR